MFHEKVWFLRVEWSPHKISKSGGGETEGAEGVVDIWWTAGAKLVIFDHNFVQAASVLYHR